MQVSRLHNKLRQRQAADRRCRGKDAKHAPWTCVLTHSGIRHQQIHVYTERTAFCLFITLPIITREALMVYTSLEGYSAFEIARVSSLSDLILTNRDRMAADPALSLVPDARAPPKGCCPTTAPN